MLGSFCREFLSVLAVGAVEKTLKVKKINVNELLQSKVEVKVSSQGHSRDDSSRSRNQDKHGRLPVKPSLQ